MISTAIKIIFKISDILSWIACLFFGALALSYPFISFKLAARDPSYGSASFIITVVAISTAMTALFYLNTRRKFFAAPIISTYFLCLAIYKSTAMHYTVSAVIIFIITAPLLLSYVEMKLFKKA
jgi:NO-binding membrane sensor protein with MHYT domain